MLRAIKFNIRTKIAIGYFLILVCLGASILAVTDRIEALQTEVESITSRDVEIHNLIASIQYDAISMETAQRGFIITGDTSYLEPYDLGKSQWEANYNSLYAYISDNPSTQKALEEIKLSIQEWISKTAEPTIAMKKENRSADIIAFFQDDVGKQQMDSLRAKFDAVGNQEVQSTRLHIIDLENKNRILTIGIYVLLLAATIISLMIVSFVSGSIVKTIKQVVRTITEIASSGGDLGTRIKVNTNDEIKELGDATNRLLASLEAQSWIQAKVAEVATMNQGINDLGILARSFLTKVAPMINASYGVFYIRRGAGEQQRLEKLASYAGTGEEAGKESFRFGEGLVGQCALEKRVFLLNQPDQAPLITTGLVQLEPRSILMVPIEYEERLEAVIEFASLQSFTTQHLKLLEEIEQDFGIAVNNVAGRMEVERLLSESQVLTEELQMQQEEMRMTTEHLEEQYLVAEQKTKELEKAKEELEDYSEQLQKSSQYKTNFLANMSHELRTPLNSILILSQLLAENENQTLNDDEEGYAKVIHTSGTDLLKLIDDILDLSKIEAGKVVLTIDEVNLTEIPEMMKLTFNPVAEKKELAFIVDMADNLPDVWYTDGQRLQQILKNLLSNAFKFTEKGSVHLQIERAGDETLAISVTDTGIGIPMDKQKLIFEAFQQVDGNTNRLYGGTGLGLSITSEFVKLLGGYIKLNSSVGRGSCFTIYLPELSQERLDTIQLAMQESAAAAEQLGEIPVQEESGNETDSSRISENEQTSGSNFAGKKVLLVEDDARNVFALVQALESKKMQVTVAGNGRRCMDILEENTDFDLVLMDIMMPLMDGYETMREIRKLPQLQDMPIIALTAKAMKSDRDKCLEAGASDYISKPLQMDQLFSLMRVWLTKQVSH
ncbi:two-component system, chemotaxis family, sensor kinase CheA [Paenibacillus catalpae]|uniref:Circadian input-output histidine kinase CikA n=1 Tax=Paenibacillus catalpae TaxID=1045775 RepID=A0A1I2BJS1_9BACL|nr:ATP-binding protein [Paenibacillus catalpae]SFE56058.1 two-component system, chemotaxis family, sensor kinase CheA [Paenibacillus catalpae]